MKNFYKKNKKIIAYLILPVALLIILIYLGISLFNLYKKPINFKNEPKNIINIPESFSGSVYFNDVLGKDDFSDLMIENIDNAQKTIEVAMYSMDNAIIKEALYRAADRGILINLVFSTKRQDGIANFINNSGRPNIKIYFATPGGTGYMHHKFMIIDKNTNKQKLFFSSYNFTAIQGKFDPSFILETDRPEIISTFSEEFNRLNNQDGTQNTNRLATRINYPEGFLEIWFAPGTKNNNLKNRMIDLIKNTKDNIKVMIWYLTDADIAANLIAIAKTKPVTIIADDFNLQTVGSMFPVIQAQKERDQLDNLKIINDSKRNLEVSQLWPGSTLNSFLHQHLLIIDDQTIVFGTSNWSANGFFDNNEATMVSDIPNLVKSFTESYSTNYRINK
jgi:phosphatidylserine/phosphatidylglycerophosphate/cardiolipin synthase-like enzyme